MVYEAGARIRDPVYGCAGAVFQLQKQVNELQAQLAKAQAQVVNMQLQQANVLALLCMDMDKAPSSPPPNSPQSAVGDTFITNSSYLSFMEDINNDANSGSLWEPLWT
ncbi:hypothetical protein Godav_000198 [Gossypium davidsonii]|nr:hypothetical protein [Gossypium davidsonii]MBA0667025.1 hypothetical protein [Gossypium klotzschianum]